MKKSKLEFYEEIICTLAQKSLALDDLAFKCNMNCAILQKRLEFLVENKIVSIELSGDNRTFYELSRRGISISKTFQITRRLERLRNAGGNRERSLPAIPALSNDFPQKQKIGRAWQNQNR
jgi:predicted transcriptional regulator